MIIGVIYFYDFRIIVCKMNNQLSDTFVDIGFIIVARC